MEETKISMVLAQTLRHLAMDIRVTTMARRRRMVVTIIMVSLVVILRDNLGTTMVIRDCRVVRLEMVAIIQGNLVTIMVNMDGRIGLLTRDSNHLDRIQAITGHQGNQVITMVVHRAGIQETIGHQGNPVIIMVLLQVTAEVAITVLRMDRLVVVVVDQIAHRNRFHGHTRMMGMVFRIGATTHHNRRRIRFRSATTTRHRIAMATKVASQDRCSRASGTTHGWITAIIIMVKVVSRRQTQMFGYIMETMASRCSLITFRTPWLITL